jgi:predicted RNA-binding Zn ribbon-like protein
MRFRSGAGRLCLDFVRTHRYRGTVDALEELTDAAALRAWIHQLGPFADAAPSDASVRDARALREAIYELVTSGPASCRAAVRQRLNRFALLASPAPFLSASGSLEWRAEEAVSATFSLLARDALDLATSPLLARVRQCAGPRCGALFLDTSRPGTRRWCSMEICGNQAKKSTLRAKSKAS